MELVDAAPVDEDHRPVEPVASKLPEQFFRKRFLQSVFTEMQELTNIYPVALEMEFPASQFDPEKGMKTNRYHVQRRNGLNILEPELRELFRGRGAGDFVPAASLIIFVEHGIEVCLGYVFTF